MATESARAALAYGFEQKKYPAIYGDADINNIASCKVLQKAGLKYLSTFDDDGYAVQWYGLTKAAWLNGLTV